MTLVPLKPRRLSKPTAKGGSQLNRGKAEFRKRLSLGPANAEKTSHPPHLRKILQKVMDKKGLSATQEQTTWVSLDASKQPG